MSNIDFMKLAETYSTFSRDPNTKVGALAVCPAKRVKAMGFNGFPSGFPDTTENWTSPTKHRFVVHAEANMVCSAAREVLEGTTAYVTHLCCSSCARLMVQSGIKKVVSAGRKVNGNHYDLEDAYQILKACGVKYEVLS